MTDYHISHQIEDELIDNPTLIWFAPDTWTAEQAAYLVGLGVDPTVRQSRFPIINAIKKTKRHNLPKTLQLPAPELDLVVRRVGGGYLVFDLDKLPQGTYPIGPMYLHRKGTPRTERAIDYPFRAMSRVRYWLADSNGSS